MKILTYPKPAHEIWKIHHIFKYLGVETTTNPDHDWDIAINTVHACTYAINNYPFPDAINGYFYNELKTYVSEVHYDVFGYTWEVDPLRHIGMALKKSNFNAVKYGEYVQCPRDREKDFVFARIIDTQLPNFKKRDIRVVWMNGIKFIVAKDKQPDEPFKTLSTTEYNEIEDPFTANEIDKISEFCYMINLDYGEIDILRSNYDNRIYIVDVNNLPGYGWLKDKVWLQRYSDAFKESFLDG